MTTKQRITVSIGTDEYRELQALARTHNVSMAWLGRKAISLLLKRSAQRELPLLFDNERHTRTFNS